ncbi:MAG: hypothetical protein ACOYJ6_18370 [Caulobacterales bacterium]
MGRDLRKEPPPLKPWPAPPDPNFPPWLDRLLWPIAGPHLSWWVAALRATLALRILPFLMIIPLAQFLQAMGAPQDFSSAIDRLYRSGGWSARGETFLAGMWASIVFFVMAWQFRIWAPKVGRRRAYLATVATVATHAAVNGVIALLWGASRILT